MVRLATVGRIALAVVAVFLAARAIVELVTVDPTDPASYRTDWGGPHYAGVLAVHVLPGALAVTLAVMVFRRRRPRR